MPTPEEIRATLKQRLETLGVSRATACEIVGVSTAQLSRFLNGATGTDLDDLQRIHLLVNAMESLQQQAAPIPVDFTHIEAIRDLLPRIMWGTLKIHFTDTSNHPAALKPRQTAKNPITGGYRRIPLEIPPKPVEATRAVSGLSGLESAAQDSTEEVAAEQVVRCLAAIHPANDCGTRCG
jgi:predicted transcriptional regulator